MCSFIFIRQRSDRWEGHTLISRSSGGFQYHFWFVSLTLRWFRENICNRVCFYFSAKIIHTAHLNGIAIRHAVAWNMCVYVLFSLRAQKSGREKNVGVNSWLSTAVHIKAYSECVTDRYARTFIYTNARQWTTK